jgi:DNA-binding NarL/FixJ family response regulator
MERIDPLDPGRRIFVVEPDDEIGRMLHITRRTVERHRENVLAKLGLRDRVQLTRYAIRHEPIDA